MGSRKQKNRVEFTVSNVVEEHKENNKSDDHEKFPANSFLELGIKENQENLFIKQEDEISHEFLGSLQDDDNIQTEDELNDEDVDEGAQEKVDEQEGQINAETFALKEKIRNV